MGIFLLVLKIIGIVLLAILGLVVLLILSILFTPVRYKIEGELKEALKGYAVISFFLHIIHIRCNFHNQDIDVIVRIFGFPKKIKMDTSDDDEVKIKTKKSKPSKAPKNRKKSKKAETQDENESSAFSAKERLHQVTQSDKEEIVLQDKEPSNEQQNVKDGDPANKRKTAPKQKKTVKGPFGKLKEKLKQGKDQIVNIKNIIYDENNKYAASFALKELMRILKHYGPRKMKAEVDFGTPDPAVTGTILGGISIFPFIYRYNIHIRPDFDSERYYLKGTFFIRGYMRGIHAVTTGIRFLRDKKIRIIINKFRK